MTDATLDLILFPILIGGIIAFTGMATYAIYKQFKK